LIEAESLKGKFGIKHSKINRCTPLMLLSWVSFPLKEVFFFVKSRDHFFGSKAPRGLFGWDLPFRLKRPDLPKEHV